MTNYSLLFFALVLFSCQHAQDLPIKRNCAIGSKAGLWYEKKQLAHGLYIQLNDKDTVFLIPVIQGKKEGECRSYYPGNKINEVRSYKNNVYEGRHYGYWPNGKKRFETEYVAGEFHGTRKEWNPEGRLVLEMHYDNGHEEGFQKVWYDNGQPRSNYQVINGRRYGLLGTKNCINVAEVLQ